LVVRKAVRWVVHLVVPLDVEMAASSVGAMAVHLVLVEVEWMAAKMVVNWAAR